MPKNLFFANICRRKWKLFQAIVNYYNDQMTALLEEKCDVLAIETVPSLGEIKCIIKSLNDLSVRHNLPPIWVSCSCKVTVYKVTNYSMKQSSSEVNHGESFAQCVDALNQCTHITCVGINCTDPMFVTPLLHSINTNKPIVVYPNCGDTYNEDGT
jgi:homocysteine S-methyltransferase